MQLFLTTSDVVHPERLTSLVEIPDARTLPVRGDRCETLAALFDEWAAALQFPDYFGRNWDAFNECINDLHDWLDTTRFVIAVSSADQLLAAQPPPQRLRDLSILTDILATASGDFVDEPDRRDLAACAVVLIVNPQARGQFLALVESTGARVRTL